MPAVLLSHIANGNGEDAIEQGIEFLKILIYFLLLIAVVTTATRLRQLLLWLGMFSAALTLIAVLRYHAFEASPPVPPTPPDAPVEDKGKNKKTHLAAVTEKTIDPETHELVDIQRMCGTGIFNDPNDLALVLITAIPLCCYWLTDPKRKALRPVWIAMILLFGYALMLTHSRGGLLSLMVGMGVFMYLRFGSAKTLLLGMMVLPLMLAVFAGRQTEISASEGTGQSRIQLWCDGLMFFQQAPLFGIGMEEYRNVSYHVAHNSYIHCYAELGVVGGTLFVGAFYFALYGMYRLKDQPLADRGRRRLQ